VSSDVHEFLELLECARALPPEAAIEAYEAALALYKGDLLDSSDMASYRWMYDEGPQVSLTLCSDYRRLQREARLRLANLLGAGIRPGSHGQRSCTRVCAPKNPRTSGCGQRCSVCTNEPAVVWDWRAPCAACGPLLRSLRRRTWISRRCHCHPTWSNWWNSSAAGLEGAPPRQGRRCERSRTGLSGLRVVDELLEATASSASGGRRSGPATPCSGVGPGNWRITWDGRRRPRLVSYIARAKVWSLYALSELGETIEHNGGRLSVRIAS
jgi:hypothetical protein